MTLKVVSHGRLVLAYTTTSGVTEGVVEEGGGGGDSSVCMSVGEELGDGE